MSPLPGGGYRARPRHPPSTEAQAGVDSPADSVDDRVDRDPGAEAEPPPFNPRLRPLGYRAGAWDNSLAGVALAVIGLGLVVAVLIVLRSL